jgi:hypothetical protein
MKQNKYPQNKKSVVVSTPTVAADINQNETDFTPSPDEVARRAYFSYVNQGSSQGHEVQHWLEAEAQLLEERKFTRVHGFHNKT